MEPLTEEDTVRLVRSLAFSEREGEGEETARLKRFGGWLHNETGGQPLFLSETLSALVERGVLVHHREAGGWTVDVGVSPGGMVPPGVREAILARLARLGPGASMLLAAAAVLGRPSDFEDLRRVAGMDEDEGLSALEEALASGLLRKVAGDAASPVDAYVCAHDKIRDVIYTEAGGARRRVYHRRALGALEREGTSAANLLAQALEVAETSGDRAAVAETEWNLAQMAIHRWEPDAASTHAEKALQLARQLGLEELAARSLDTLGISHNFAGRWDECVAHTREAAALYARMADRGVGSLAAQYLLVGSPPSVALHNRAMEAQCLATVAVAEVNRGKLAASVNAGRAALKIGQEINNEWTQALAATNLSQGLIEDGGYGEALRTAQEGVRIAREVPDPVLPLIALYAAGNAHQAMLGLEEAQRMYQEALEVADRIPQSWRLLMATRLCANRALAGDWEAAHRYALDSVRIRDAAPARLMWLDFVRHHETESLLRGGEEKLAREGVKRLGGRVGGNRRFRLVHLRMLAVLAEWDGQPAEALARLQEARTLAEEIGLPGELWQIWAAIGELHEQRGEPEDAHGAFSRAAGIVERLAGEIEDEALKEAFLLAPQLRRVLETSARKP